MMYIMQLVQGLTLLIAVLGEGERPLQLFGGDCIAVYLPPRPPPPPLTELDIGRVIVGTVCGLVLYKGEGEREGEKALR